MAAPTPQALGQVLSDCLGRRVEVTVAPAAHIKTGEATVSASYCADDQSVASVIICDHASVIFAGAALGLYPAQAAKEDVAARRLDESLVENFGEILNICAAWVSGVVKRHVRFGTLYMEQAKQPPEVQSLHKSNGPRLYLNWNIAGYGTGRITLLR